MSDMRAAIKDGDATSTDGTVFGTGRFRHNGVEVAAEGDQTTCPACKTVGTLYNDAYPAFRLQDGRQILVEGAWLQCKCTVAPRVIASQHNFRIGVTRGGSTVSPSAWSAILYTEHCRQRRATNCSKTWRMRLPGKTKP